MAPGNVAVTVKLAEFLNVTHPQRQGADVEGALPVDFRGEIVARTSLGGRRTR
jgi:hypothetical protein